MLCSIPENEINNLSLEMIFYYMFKEYPDIIDWYNNSILMILREEKEQKPIDDLREKLVWVNKDLLLNWNSETENIFIEWMKKVYEWFKIEWELIVNDHELKERINTLKNEEYTLKNEETKNANNIINNFNF